MRWLIVIGLVGVAALLATRGMSPISRAAAAEAFGRRFMWLVLGWRVWRVVAALAVVGVAVFVATSGGRSAAPATSSGGASAAAPPVRSPAPAAPPADLPLLSGGLFVAAAAVALCVLAAVAAGVVFLRRRREARELRYWLAEDEPAPGPLWLDPEPYVDGTYAPRREEYETGDGSWEQAGTDPTERVDITEEPDEHGSSERGTDSGHADVDADNHDDGDEVGVEDLVVPHAGASIHDLTRRRRSAHRRL